MPAPLDPAATQELFRKARQGDELARQRLVEHNLRLVRAVVRRFREARLFIPVDDDDLFQAGCIGLLQAVDGFDPERGIQFSTYAVPFILGEIRRYVRQQVAPDLPRSLWQRSGQVATVRTRFLQQWGREPTLAELSRLTGLSTQDVAEALEVQEWLGELSRTPGTGLATPVPEPGQEDARLEGTHDRVALHEALARLPPADRLLLELRFFRQLSQPEVAARLGLSQPHISRRERQLLARLRSGFSDR
ncbi:MAG: sigma-70 family RNA polymerase sigma factor [Limnochordales bacterium]|nr:sigma-70 family RNA polymerase sigma factor [Limnochordales bacterium]